MRVAVLSDTHFGDPLCTLVSSGTREKEPSIGPAYEPLARAVGKVDYLVLLGDILDTIGTRSRRPSVFGPSTGSRFRGRPTSFSAIPISPFPGKRKSSRTSSTGIR